MPVLTYNICVSSIISTLNQVRFKNLLLASHWWAICFVCYYQSVHLFWRFSKLQVNSRVRGVHFSFAISFIILIIIIWFYHYSGIYLYVFIRNNHIFDEWTKFNWIIYWTPCLFMAMSTLNSFFPLNFGVNWLCGNENYLINGLFCPEISFQLKHTLKSFGKIISLKFKQIKLQFNN